VGVVEASTYLRPSLFALTVAAASGCGPGPIVLDDQPDERDPIVDHHHHQELWRATNTDVDFLFVIDNSGSMGPAQANLATSFPAFIEALEASGVNYRIGITTTDNGNPWCPGVTTPEHGHLVMSSCKSRLDDFLFSTDVDVRDLACNDVCTLDAAEIEILPTTTEYDATPTPRPWLEHIEGRKNIPATTDIAAAFACFAPQGVNGCGYEQPLESMYLALVRGMAVTEPEYGFLRKLAALVIVIVTDDYALPSNVDVCYAMLTDPGGLTAPDADDISAECLAHGYNLEFKLVRRFPALSGTTVSASCTLAGSPELSCPGIGG
jgi:hypothetical protein